VRTHPLTLARWPVLACALTALVGRPGIPGHPSAIRASGHDASAGSTLDPGDPEDEPFSAEQRARLFERLGVERWHHLGSRGQGVKVAILDTGFRGYRAHLGEALPERVTARSFRSDGDLEAKNSQHGILCGEVVHALAPDAELLLANWDPDRPDEFLAAARWARQQGARVISCSVIMPSWSDGEGSGPIHAALTRILGTGGEPGDLLCFASAGNIAQRHWSGAFHADAQGFHEWVPGQGDNPLTPWGTEPVSVEVCWHGGADYDLAVADAATGAPVSESPARAGLGRSCAVTRFLPRPGHTYRVRLRLAAGRPGNFHLVVLGSGLGHATAQGSIPFPGDGREVVAVGAVDDSGKRTSYSSCGLNPAEPKPDLVATVPFPSLWRPRPFAGTSAAAPQAAALAALVWSHSPRWTAGRVRQTLYAAAHDLGPPGPDCETGYGLIGLPPAEALSN
jgi:subtilisin family serine protease